MNIFDHEKKQCYENKPLWKYSKVGKSISATINQSEKDEMEDMKTENAEAHFVQKTNKQDPPKPAAQLG